MISLYHPKTRVIREIAKDDAVRLRALKRAGFRIGTPPPVPEPKVEVEDPVLPVEDDEVVESTTGEPEVAEHPELSDLLSEIPAGDELADILPEDLPEDIAAEEQVEEPEEATSEEAVEDDGTEEVGGVEEDGEDEAVASESGAGSEDDSEPV